MLSCQRGHNKIVDFFCRIGADIDGQTAQASTALMLATKRGHKEVVLTLLKYGANMDILDNR
jgi:ankyrin repeat protein